MLFSEKTVKEYLEKSSHIKENEIIRINLNTGRGSLDLLSVDYGSTWIIAKLGRLYSVFKVNKNACNVYIERLENPITGVYSHGFIVDLTIYKDSLYLDSKFITTDYKTLEKIHELSFYSHLPSNLLKATIFKY